MNPQSITLQGLAIASLLASLLIAIFLPLRPLLRRIIGSQWLCLLWLALLMRLLVPLPLESSWSMFSHWQSRPDPIATPQTPVKVKVTVLDHAASADNSATSKNPIAANVALPSHINVFFALWLSGFAISLCMLVWRLHQTRRLATHARPATDSRLLHIYSSLPPEWRRNVRLMTTDVLQIPTLAGVIHPQIWMPQSWPAKFTDDELRNVFLHELGHARRGDLLVQWLFAFAQCLHWFNPLVWLATRAARFDREMACDAWALARNEADHSGYGAALLKTVEFLRAPVHTARGAIAMASDRRSLHMRISGIGAFRPVPAWRGIAAGLVVVTALVVITTERSTGQEKQAAIPAPTITTTPAPAPDTTVQPATPPAKPSGPQVEIKTHFFEISEKDAKQLGLIDLISAVDAKKLGYKEELPLDEKASMPGGGMLGKEALESLMTELNKAHSVNLLSAPTVTTISKQRAVIEIVREFRYPTEYDKGKDGKPIPTAFETRNTGITVEVEPTVTPNQEIQLQFAPQIVSFLGFINYGEKSAGKITRPANMKDEFDSMNFDMSKPQFEAGSIAQPVFSTRKLTTSITLTSGQSAIVGGFRSEIAKDRLIFIIVTATIVPQDSEPAPAQVSHIPPPQPTPAPHPDTSIPYGVPAENKPGFVTSPFAPDAGLIDVQGFPSNTEVKDPYTGKMFLVP